MAYSLDIKDVLRKVMDKERAEAMEVEMLPVGKGFLYSVKLKSKENARAQGFAHITAKTFNGSIGLKDLVKLEEKNRGFESDLSSLKCCMYYDLGATSQEGGVSNLRYSPGKGGHLVSFKVSKDKAPKALHHYLDTTCEVMGGFFRNYGSIELAISMARERGKSQFSR